MLLKRLQKIVLFFFLFLLFVPVCRAQSTYTFIGNFENYETDNGAVTIHAQNGSVRLTYFKNIGFRVRYAFDNTFKPVFSYATLDSALHQGQPEISNQKNRLVLTTNKGAQLRVQKNPVRLTFATSGGIPFIQDDFGAGHAGQKITQIIKKPDSATYYGLGEKASDLNRTGKSFTLWNSDTPGYAMNQDPLYKSFPFYIGLNNNKAYGVYYDNSFKSTFDFGGKLKQDVYYSAEGGELRYYVFYGPDMHEVLQKYTHLTGRSPLPPKWALGYQQSRWGYYPEKELYRLADAFRSRQIPLDMLYLDIDYMNGYRVFTWDKKLFPTPQKMLSDLKDRGIKTTVIIDPGVKKDSTYFMFNEGRTNDYFVKMPDSSDYIGEVWPGQTAFPDFSRPATRKWWGHSYKKLIDEGVSGIWTDMNEPAVFGGKTMPNIAVFNKDGHHASALEMHNLYGLLMARTTYQGLKKLYSDRRPFVITRAAFSGVQRYSSVWTGDNSATWDDVDLTMPMIMGLGMSGEPFAGFDIGGFMGSPDGEMYMRFLQIGIFMPFCRTHSTAGTRAQNPWSYGPTYTHINKALIDLRYKMLPQLYTAFYEHTQTGLPIIRPLVMKFQDDRKTYNIDDQFFLGDHLMVAPVIRQGNDARKVYLPKGKWYRMFSDRQFKGGKTIHVDAPIITVNSYDKVYKNALDGVPIFVQAGAVLPMQQVQQYVGEKDIDVMQLNIYCGGDATSKLYEDAGKGFDYKEGQFRLTTFSTHDSKQQLAVDVTQRGDYSDAVRTFEFIVHGMKKKPGSVSADGKNIDFNYDDSKRIIRFKSSAKVSNIHVEK